MSARRAVPPSSLAIALCLAGIIAFASAAWTGGPSAAAGAPPEYEMHLELAVPDGEGGWSLITIVMLLDPYVPDFEQQAAEARAGMLARFPGAIDLSASGPAAQYRLIGFAWPGNTASWSYNDAGRPASAGNAASAIAGGASTWNTQGADWAFTGGGASDLPSSICQDPRSIDRANVVGWDVLDGNALAVTCWLQSRGNPVEFDMLFDRDRTWADEVDLFTVALHEFGHALGLGHSKECGPGSYAVMCPTYGGAASGPHADDLAGLFAIYGPSGPTPTPTNTATPTMTPPPPTPSVADRQVALTPGHNFIVWLGTDAAPGVGLASALAAVDAAYSWDAANQVWHVYIPAQSPAMNTLDELVEGGVYWIYASASATFTAPR